MSARAAWHLAQVNIALPTEPLTSARLAGFVELLDPVNALADGAPGFVWRLQTDDGDATAVTGFGDDRVIINLTVWESVDQLADFVFDTFHVEVMRRRREWFERMREAYTVAWWIPAGTLPSVADAERRLDLLRTHGPHPEAFTLQRPFAAPDQEREPADLTGPAVPGVTDGLGPVAALWRYPVKSMAGVPLETAEVGWAGVAGDRRWAFVRPDSQANGFPWHTIRELPTMGHYVPRHVDPDRPDHSDVQVQTPAGRCYDLTDPELAAELGPGVSLFRENRGIFDDAPLTLITTATVAALCDLAGVPADPQRFRPNLLIDAVTPYAEDDWVGHTLAVGDVVIRVDQRDPRCRMVDVNPVTGRPDAKLLKVIGRERRACAGVYATVVRTGTIRLGDPVRRAD